VSDPSAHRIESRAPLDRLAWWLSVWFGCGLLPVAPGTWGTLGALPLYFGLVYLGGAVAVGAGALVMTFVGIWAAHRVAGLLGKKDPQIICVDEVAGVLIALAVAPRTWAGIATAVLLFRLTDVVKPWPARQLERCPGGWGIVLDDVAAGVWAALGVLAGRRLGWL
jgi:phosphatidylglycerophosphatase A